MQTLLAIECSSHVGAVAYLRDITRPDEWAGESTRDEVKLSAWVLPAIERVLAKAGASGREVQVVAFGAGPGSFTGVRTACATAQALAYSWKTPLIVVDSLEALAEASGLSCVDVVLDARMNELYAAAFERSAVGDLRRISETRICAATAFAAHDSTTVLGSGASLVNTGNVRATTEDLRAAEARWAYGVARVAVRKLARSETTEPRDAEPIYVRNKVALTEAERAAKAPNTPERGSA